MLGPGRYSQWHSRFLRYLDTKSNGEYLRKCIFDGPYLPTNLKKELFFLILTGIGDEIYSTVDACNTAKEMWTAIERLQQGESLNAAQPYSENTIRNLYLKDRLHHAYMLISSTRSTALPDIKFGNQRTSDKLLGLRETVGRSVVQKTGYSALMQGFGHYEGMQAAKVAGLVEDTDEEIDEQELEAHYSYMAKIQEVSHAEGSSSTVDQNATESVDERVALANLIANLTLDTEENKTVLKQLKKANASLTQELKECKTNLDESSRALGEATSSRDSSLIALQTKQTELEKYTALNDLTIVNQKHDELVKKSLLTRSQFEGQLKEKTKVISDLKVKEGKDIDTMIEMVKQIKFLMIFFINAISQLDHNMLAPNHAQRNHGFCPIGKDTADSEKVHFCILCLFYANTELALLYLHNVKEGNLLYSVSRPQLKSYQVKEKVVPNISQVKFTKKEVEDHHRISSISKKTKSVTACNDSSNSRTSNVNAVCAECGKCGYVTIKWVYYIEGLNHNLFSVGQFYDADLEVAFRKSTCFVRELQDNELLTWHWLWIDGFSSELRITHLTLKYTWTLFLRSKDETPEVLKDFLTMIQRNLQAQVITVRTDRGTEFLNKTLHAYFKEEGIEHQTSTPRTLDTERRCRLDDNRTRVEAARTMLSASKLPIIILG
ncbi:retrovirus-related pol polyprotein from transposon TNT 1-94 [Tanacetum coccineum]|uniref:Retrovirus-related pol polyprotein from transposon TNT 1-94 n=1 Tax=Tanacetum coccineum TaxID=301880 RepID=A0ABQ4X2E9_9ASTR